MSVSPEHGDILIVDDKPENLKVLMSMLTKQGYKVRPAINGKLALTAVQEHLPDLILLDIHMPELNGYEVCERLKADPATQDIPVIFISALNDTLDKVKAFQMGGVDYITKPFQVEEVLARIETHLTLRQLQTQLTDKNEELLAVNDTLRQRNEELDAFAYTVAHDLKNPLSSIIANAELLLESWPSPAEQEDAAQAVIRGGQRMEGIIKNLLMLAQMRKVDVVPQPLDMAEIVAEVEHRLERDLKQAGATIILPKTWPIAVGYAPWVEEVWANYLENAIKYGGHPLRIEIGAVVQPNQQVEFWVKDNGDGLSAEAQTQLFEPFAKLNRNRKGHGLGLSIVKTIVEKLGGGIGVHSNGVPGEGACFIFTLPAME